MKIELSGMRELNKQEMSEVDGGFIAVAYWVVRGGIYVATNPAARAAVGKGIQWVSAGGLAYTAYKSVK